MHSVGGPFATCIFTGFRGTPARSGPGATIMDSVWGPSGAPVFYDVCSSGHSPDGPLRGSAQVRPEPPLSVPYGAGRGGYFPRVQMVGDEFVFGRHLKKDPTIST